MQTKLDDIKEILSPWLKLETWHTSHPLDTKRFNKSLFNLFDKYGVNGVYVEEFSEAILASMKDYHPKLSEEFLDSRIQDFSTAFEYISTYLDDIKE
ncbi:hypothetical protein [uncultured Acinetobacter sp.]|uniref:hypothetical protein n=1 Tax=uncultured Acinetobacter sp. TaxID=165433 RepID=UPI00258DD71D|nr:hypothetical protein [uncultured Acinetobacter sp.]